MIAESDNAGLIARTAYTYLHIPIVAGVVVTAVADEKMLAHPIGHSELSFNLVAIGGPMLFLFGNQMFKWVTSGTRIPPFSLPRAVCHGCCGRGRLARALGAADRRRVGYGSAGFHSGVGMVFTAWRLAALGPVDGALVQPAGSSQLIDAQ